ncbi:hypothetical protein [Streptomyces cuspidosporus]|uniref:Glycosyl hydrolase family 67 C-terminal domain-containing protein n=1 Tax=Streptomyces cuspidosporus TaxID=66882 RepID=A0ABN3FLJ5_9ACTN
MKPTPRGAVYFSYIAQANLYAVGRLAWQPDADPGAVLDEWIELSFVPGQTAGVRHFRVDRVHQRARAADQRAPGPERTEHLGRQPRRVHAAGQRRYGGKHGCGCCHGHP